MYEVERCDARLVDVYTLAHCLPASVPYNSSETAPAYMFIELLRVGISRSGGMSAAVAAPDGSIQFNLQIPEKD